MPMSDAILCVLVNAADIRGGVGHFEVRGILRGHALDQIHLLQGQLYSLKVLGTLTGIQTDQNCAPTCPARRRGISVINAA